jgi:hypothetical protein
MGSRNLGSGKLGHWEIWAVGNLGSTIWAVQFRPWEFWAAGNLGTEMCF